MQEKEHEATLARFDCGSMFTWANMDLIVDKEAPELLARCKIYRKLVKRQLDPANTPETSVEMELEEKTPAE